jgi:hypothetical protein
MRTLGLKVLIVVVATLVGAIIMHSLVYLSIDPGSLSAQMPEQQYGSGNGNADALTRRRVLGSPSPNNARAPSSLGGNRPSI